MLPWYKKLFWDLVLRADKGVDNLVEIVVGTFRLYR
jgi:hypothetical protein